jgi:hypothetical protein
MDGKTRMHLTHPHHRLPTLANGREAEAILHTEGDELSFL